jgi:hypothetical protein
MIPFNTSPRLKPDPIQADRTNDGACVKISGGYNQRRILNPTVADF